MTSERTVHAKNTIHPKRPRNAARPKRPTHESRPKSSIHAARPKRHTHKSRPKRTTHAGQIFYPMLAIAILLLSWQALVTFNIVPHYLLPSPIDVIVALIGNASLLLHHAATSITEAILGLTWGIVIGVLAAVIMDWIAPLKKALRPLITLSQSVPTVAIAPLLVLWLGYGMLPKIVLVALTCFFPICISMLEGFSATDTNKIDLMRTMKASKGQIFWHLKLPASLSYFFSGLKVGAAYAIVGAVIAEWMGGISGLGVYMTRVRKSYAYDEMFASILVIAVLSLVLMGLVNLAEKYLVPWNRTRVSHATSTSAILAGVALIGALLVIPGFVLHNANRLSDGAQGASNQQTLEPITFVLDYTPNTNHLGIYAAKELGYYAQEGLDVQIVQPPEDGAEAMVGAGQAEFGMSYQDTLANFLFAKNAVPITAVAAVLQHNTSGIMSSHASHIARPRDLEGKTYATMQSATEEAILKELVLADGGDFSKVRLVPAGTTDEVSGLKGGLFDAIWSFSGWGKQNADLNNLDVDFQNLTDFNKVFDYYTPVIIANDSFLAEKPNVAKRFLAATAKGYIYAVEHPHQAADILLKYAPETNAALAHASAAALASEYVSDAPYWGYIDKNRWSSFYQWLHDKELLETARPAEIGFTNEFLGGGNNE